ncbi:MAG: hypothetical protein L6301_16900 [Desulfobacteraceae bacterium]|nr:hypothetical protein [Pseudomonadota bacterium]MCG2753515.1 hypothetical protein [Desulfobacteraceae bacterium]
MDLNKKRMMIKNRPVFTVTAVILSLFFLVTACGKKETEGPESNGNEPFPESFTFFNMESNTLLNDSTLEELKKAFGANAVTRRTTLDLEIHQRGLLAKEFAELAGLNEKLNGVSNERVEHDTTLLTYRYPPETNKFFKYIRIWFSNLNNKPLMVEILTEAGSQHLIDGIREKYGKPKSVALESDRESLEYWVLSRDTLMVSKTQNRYGADIYQIKIYFVNNMEIVALKEPGGKSIPGDSQKAPDKINLF